MASFKAYLQHRLLENLQHNVRSPWMTTPFETAREVALALRKHCNHNLEQALNGQMLYRGDKTLKAVTVDTTHSLRTSRDTNNLYQLVLDAAEEYADVPSRSRSIICTTGESVAENYSSSICILIPYDNTPIAVAESDDLIYQTVEGLVGLDVRLREFSSWLSLFIAAINENRAISFQTQEALASAIEPSADRIMLAKLIKHPYIGVLSYLEGVSVDPDYSTMYVHKEGYPKLREINSFLDKAEIVQLSEASRRLKRADVSDFGALRNIPIEKLNKVLKVLDEFTPMHTRTATTIPGFMRAMMQFADDYLRRPEDFVQTIGTKYLNPKSLRISVVHDMPTTKDAECWLSGRCIVIPKEYYETAVIDALAELEDEA